MDSDAPILLFGESYHHPNIFYRTRFLAPDPVVVVDKGGDDVTMWVSVLEEGRARKESSANVRCTTELNLGERMRNLANEGDAWAVLLEAVCQEHGLSNVDVDTDFPALYADHLRNSDVAVRARSDLYLRQRRIKTPQEIEWITQTENAGMEGLQRAIDIIKAADIKDGILYRDGKPLSGEDLILAVESRILEFGCTTTDSICCGGPESADPHRSSSEVLRVGLPIVLDIFPFHKSTRYWGDMTRTVVRGTPPPEVQRMWDATLEAQAAGCAEVKPGANARDVHTACCEVYKRYGYGSATKGYKEIESRARFIHGTGHGLGLEIHEFPRASESDITLEVGDVITVEPGLYDPELGGVRIEDLLVVTEDGYRNLTTLPKIFRLDD